MQALQNEVLESSELLLFYSFCIDIVLQLQYIIIVGAHQTTTVSNTHDVALPLAIRTTANLASLRILDVEFGTRHTSNGYAEDY